MADMSVIIRFCTIVGNIVSFFLFISVLCSVAYGDAQAPPGTFKITGPVKTRFARLCWVRWIFLFDPISVWIGRIERVCEHRSRIVLKWPLVNSTHVAMLNLSFRFLLAQLHGRYHCGYKQTKASVNNSDMLKFVGVGDVRTVPSQKEITLVI